VIPGHSPYTYRLLGISFPISNIREIQDQSFKTPNVTSIMQPLANIPNLTDYAYSIRKIQSDSLILANEKISGASAGKYFLYFRF
jgi:hypothetical protein